MPGGRGAFAAVRRRGVAALERLHGAAIAAGLLSAAAKLYSQASGEGTLGRGKRRTCLLGAAVGAGQPMQAQRLAVCGHAAPLEYHAIVVLVVCPQCREHGDGHAKPPRRLLSICASGRQGAPDGGDSATAGCCPKQAAGAVQDLTAGSARQTGTVQAIEPMSLSRAVVAISGAGSGIGLATAALLARRGAFLSLADRNGAAIESHAIAIEAAGGRCIAVPTDIRSASSVDEWIHSTVEAYGRLDGAVNCAGVRWGWGALLSGTADGEQVLRLPDMGRAPLSAQSDAAWDSVLDTNLGGTFRCLRAQLRAVADGGSIVNLTSTVGVQGLANDAPYCASKHGVRAQTVTMQQLLLTHRHR